MEIITGSVPFGRAHGSGPRTGSADVDFGHAITKANAVLTGMDFGFSPNDDHHLGMVDIKVDSQIMGNTVHVTATLGVRDWSGTFDDDYEGTVFFRSWQNNSLLSITLKPGRGRKVNSPSLA